MRYIITLTVIFIISQVDSFSQTEMHPQVFGTYGGSSDVSDGYNITFSAGQTFYKSYENDNFSITEGLNQAIYTVTAIYDNIFSTIKLSVYPNPSDGLINIQHNSNKDLILNISVTDLTGKILYVNEFSEKLMQINLTDLSKNVYFLNITNQQKIIKTFKIVKNK